MILKAGTYRFNDVIDLANAKGEDFNFTTSQTFDIDGVTYRKTCYFESMFADILPNGEVDNYIYYLVAFRVVGEGVDEYFEQESELHVYDVNGWRDYEGAYPSMQTITIPNDTEIADDFGTWYIANTNYNEVHKSSLVTIEYNGSTIAELNAGETATLSCKDMKMESDVVVKVNEGGSGETEDSPLPVEVATESEMTALLETAPLGSVYKYVGESGTYENGELYILREVSE